MVHTFHIDDSNGKAKALMAFLRTLEFVKEEKTDWGEGISEELESSILRGLDDEESGHLISNDSVMDELRNEFPKLKI